MEIKVTNIVLGEAFDRPFVYFDVETSWGLFSTGEYLEDGRLAWEDGNMWAYCDFTLAARQRIAEQVEEWLAARLKPAKAFKVVTNGNFIGVYHAADADGAIFAYVRDAGYRDVSGAAAALGQSEEKFLGDIDVEEVEEVEEAA